MLECLSSPDVLLEYAEGRNNIPALASLTRQVQPGRCREWRLRGLDGRRARAVPPCSAPSYPKYSAAYSAAMQAALIGEKDPQAALDEAQQTATGQVSAISAAQAPNS